MIAVRRALERRADQAGRWRSFDPEAEHPSARSVSLLRSLDEEVLAPDTTLTPSTHIGEWVIWVLEGELRFQAPSSGAELTLVAGELQWFREGSDGDARATMASGAVPARVLRIGLMGAGQPGWAQRRPQHVSRGQRRDAWCLVAAPDAGEGRLQLDADVRIFTALLQPGRHLALPLEPGRLAWVQVVRGEAAMGSSLLSRGDGALVRSEATVSLTARAATEVVLILLPDQGEELLWSGD